MLTNFTVVTISQYIHVSSQHIQLKLTYVIEQQQLNKAGGGGGQLFQTPGFSPASCPPVAYRLFLLSFLKQNARNCFPVKA